jgi:hypothetical protein
MKRGIDLTKGQKFDMKVKDGESFSITIDGAEYSCCIVSVLYDVIRYFNLYITARTQKSFLGCTYTGSAWKYKYLIGRRRMFQPVDDTIPYQTIDGTRWYDTDWVRELVSQALVCRQQEIDKILKDKRVVHAKVL